MGRKPAPLPPLPGGGPLPVRQYVGHDAPGHLGQPRGRSPGPLPPSPGGASLARQEQALALAAAGASPEDSSQAHRPPPTPRHREAPPRVLPCQEARQASSHPVSLHLLLLHPPAPSSRPACRAEVVAEVVATERGGFPPTLSQDVPRPTPPAQGPQGLRALLRQLRWRCSWLLLLPRQGAPKALDTHASYRPAQTSRGAGARPTWPSRRGWGRRRGA